MSSTDLISGLVATAEPVKPRKLEWEVAALLLVAGVQIVGAVLYFGVGSIEQAFSVDASRMLVKFSLFGVLALSFSGVALWSLDPTAKRAAPVMAAIVSVMGVVALIGLDRSWGASLSSVLAPQWGVRCFFSILSLALPITLLLSIFMVRGASTRPNQTAMFIGLAGGSWGAFTYALQCPFVGLYYLLAWYVVGIAVVALIARLVLPRIARW